MTTMKKAQTGKTVKSTNPADTYPPIKDKRGKSTIGGGEGKIPSGPKTGRRKPTMGSAKNGKSFPDLNKDGKVTKADILKGRGVIAKKGATIKKAQDGYTGEPGLAERAGPMVKSKTKVRSPDGNYVTKKVTTSKPNSNKSTTKTRRTVQGFLAGAPRVNDLKNGGKMKKCMQGCK